MTDMSSDPLVTRRAGLIEAEVDGELVALHEGNGTCYGFNGTATRVWALLAEPRRLSDLRAALAAEYDVDPQTLAADVDALLDELEADGLVERGAEDASAS